nr:ubiquitin carboxyl-terminal hydrolase 25-like [Equus asinus]
MSTRTRCATIEQSKNGSKDKRDLDVIDLTGDDKDDLQRAIALSLAESNRAFRETGITDEEQAISRVLEASIAENKACLKRTPTEVWRDSRNPYDRKRQDKAPVGLKNVGNTCWFSAVIQVRVFLQILFGGHDSNRNWLGVVFLLSCILET